MEEIQSIWADVYHCAISVFEMCWLLKKLVKIHFPKIFTLSTTSTDTSTTSAEDFESALVRFGHLFLAFSAHWAEQVCYTALTQRQAFCLLHVPISPVPSKVERPQGGERREQGEKVVVGRKKIKSWCDDFSKTHLAELDLLASTASYSIRMCSIRHAAIRSTSRSSSRFWSGHPLPPLA